MSTDTLPKDMTWTSCNLIMENLKVREMTGKETLIEVPFSFALDVVTSYRQSVDDEGYPEDYTVVYTDMGTSYCIDITYGEFDYMHKKFRNDNKTV